ncbi:AAA family ATPase [Xylophilus sp. Kf1]|nr:AAA family ATPase [Xylophilus sp. Kf1]
MFPQPSQDGLFAAPSAPSATASAPLLANLNPEQLAAVTLPTGHALILAGAGSGKTRVLTTRIAWLLQTGQVSSGGILAVTFTNKAAKEMQVRLQALLPVNTRGMWIGTFHGLCNRFLRAHYKLAHLPQAFQILDTQDMLSALKRLMKQHKVDEERFPPKQVQYFISGAKENGLRPGDIESRSEDDRKKVELYQLYEEQCQREGVVDFGELMLRSYELLRDHDAVREHYQQRFRYLLVDEFQDTNKLQYAWLKQLSGERSNVLAVGDDDQSIYAFRGANVGNMADFVREFDVKHQIKLEQNYRSYSNILDSANHLISHNSRRLGKNLRTDQGPGEPVRVFESTSDFAEAQWMVEEMRQLIRDGFDRREIAVLYRSNAQSRVIETALFNAAVPYRVYGGLRFFERAEIKHALAYLRLIENPNDDTSFMRVVNFPPRGIGARSIEQLQDAAREMGCSLHDAVSSIKGKAGSNLTGFNAMVEVMRERSQGRALRDVIHQVLDDSGLRDHYRAEREGADRLENLDELVNAAESFVTIEGFGREADDALPSQSLVSQGVDPSMPLLNQPLEQPLDGETGETQSPLVAFLTHAALEAGDNQAQAGQDAVQLMTVHASKGLEFDCVFIGGMEEGLFPHENSMNDRDGLEEERRLMYVAITRARKRLYLSHSQTRMLHGQTRYHVKSRFFEELPEAALKWITPRQSGFGAYAPQGGGSTSGSSGGGWGKGSSFSLESAPKVVVQKVAPSHGLKAGIQVFHNKFGEGKVLAIEGVDDDARAQVSFPRHGVKWLALSVAKLTVV